MNTCTWVHQGQCGFAADCTPQFCSHCLKPHGFKCLEKSSASPLEFSIIVRNQLHLHQVPVTFREDNPQLWTSCPNITKTKLLQVFVDSESGCLVALRVPSRASSHSAGSSPASSCSWTCACARAAAATEPAPRTWCPTRCAASSTSCTCRR